jgi:hypothetical protein
MAKLPPKGSFNSPGDSNQPILEPEGPKEEGLTNDVPPNSEPDKNHETMDQFLQKFKKSEDFQKMIIPRNIRLTHSQSYDVLTNFATKHELHINQALVVIALLFQSGGTNRSCDGNLQVNVFGKEIKLASLRKSLAECKLKACERKLARALATKIATISKELGIAGNLSKKISRSLPDREFTLEQQVWLSEFQVDNQDCPESLRKLIFEALKTRKPAGKNKLNKKTK